MSPKPSLLIPFITLIVGLGLGYYFGSSSSSLPLPGSSSSDMQKLQQQIEKAKEMFPVAEDIRYLYGVIEDVNQNSITVKTSESPNPFDELPREWNIAIGDNTIIIKQEQKDPAQYQKEMRSYQAKIQKISPTAGSPSSPGPYPMPPMSYTETSMTVSGLKKGDYVSVTSAENIKQKTTFEAAKIIVQSGMPGTLAPAGTPARER
jgi:hypothetical protein